jgi:hypothetical protein
MTESIPKNRLVAYGLILGLIPLGAVLLNFMSGLNEINNKNERIELIQEQALLLGQKQAVNIALMQSYKDADHFYIDKQLETIQLLEPEIEALQTAMNNKNVAEDEGIKKRHEQLVGSGNSLSFSEGVVQSTPVFQEVVESMIHPVEVNVENLKEILAKVEGIEIGPYAPGPNRPQLIILDFKIDKKNSIDKNEVFQLNMKLLKREYL